MFALNVDLEHVSKSESTSSFSNTSVEASENVVGLTLHNVFNVDGCAARVSTNLVACIVVTALRVSAVTVLLTPGIETVEEIIRNSLNLFVFTRLHIFRDSIVRLEDSVVSWVLQGVVAYI